MYQVTLWTFLRKQNRAAAESERRRRRVSHLGDRGSRLRTESIKRFRFWTASAASVVISIAVFAALFALVGTYADSKARGTAPSTFGGDASWVFVQALAIFGLPIFGLVALSGARALKWRERWPDSNSGRRVLAVGVLEGIVVVGGGWWLLTSGSDGYTLNLIMVGVGAVVGLVGAFVFWKAVGEAM